MLWLEGETRIAHVIVETARHRHSHIIGGSLPATAEDGEALLARMQHYLPQARWVVGGGSLPPGLPTDFAARIQEIAAAGGVPTLFDMTGKPVHDLLQGPGGPPTILKMNEVEFAATFGEQTEGVEALAQAAVEVAGRHKLHSLVLTLGKDGILAASPEGVFHALAPEQQVFNAAGAGDSASAGLVWRLDLGDSWPQALIWAAAVSAASVLTDRTAIVDPADVERLLPLVALHKL